MDYLAVDDGTAFKTRADILNEVFRLSMPWRGQSCFIFFMEEPS
jgi:hypothetical protein